MRDHLTTVTALYEAFGRGDIPYLLEQLADDVAWEYWESSAHEAGVPWLISRHGKAGATEFFQVISGWKFHEFQVSDMLASEQRVAVIVVVDEELPGGQRIRDEELHLWTFNADGKIAAFRHIADTAKHIAAAQAG